VRALHAARLSTSKEELMEAPLSSVRREDEMNVRLTWLEIEAVSLGLRTLLITQPRDEALCGVATAGLAKLPGVLPSDGQWSATGSENDMNRRPTLLSSD
jgi:hypothetical protein